VTRLRKMMLEELQRRNYSENTTRYYIRAVEDFSRRFNRPPDRLCPASAGNGERRSSVKINGEDACEKNESTTLQKRRSPS
jgi:hypothetical protein